MGLWYLSAVIFLAFSGLFWVYSEDRLNATQPPSSIIAGLVENCQKAGLREIYLDRGFGAQAISTARFCQYRARSADAANAYLHGEDIARNIAVPGVQLIAYRPSQVGDNTAYLQRTRWVVTYVPRSVGNLNGASFNEVVRQLRLRWPDQVEAGLVEAGVAGSYNKLHSEGDANLTRVPTTVPVGAFAIVRGTSDNGWPTNCNIGPSGTTCMRLSLTPATMNDAMSACIADGGYLAKITGSADLNDIRSLPGASGQNLWIDGSLDHSTVPPRATYSGTMIDMTYDGSSTLPWQSGEPNNVGGIENCIMLYSTGTWNDVACTTAIPYACMY